MTPVSHVSPTPATPTATIQSELWIRYNDGTKTKRFHRVRQFDHGGVWTLCSRFVRTKGVLDAIDGPPKRACKLCQVRVRFPYLVPESPKHETPGRLTRHKGSPMNLRHVREYHERQLALFGGEL